MSENKWLLKIGYVWDDETEDEEPDLEFSSFEEAWSKAKEMAQAEVDITLEEHPEAPVTTEYSLGDCNGEKVAHIILTYGYDNGVCTYSVVRW